MHLLKVHPLCSIKDGFPSIVLSQPQHRYRTPLACRSEDTVLDERVPIHQTLDALHFDPESATDLHTLEIVENEPRAQIRKRTTATGRTRAKENLNEPSIFEYYSL